MGGSRGSTRPPDGRAAGRGSGQPIARAVPPSPAGRPCCRREPRRRTRPPPPPPRPGRRPELSSASPELRQKRATRGAPPPLGRTTDARQRLKRARALTLPLLTTTATYPPPPAASRRILPATAALLPPLNVPSLIGCRPFPHEPSEESLPSTAKSTDARQHHLALAPRADPKRHAGRSTEARPDAPGRAGHPRGFRSVRRSYVTSTGWAAPRTLALIVLGHSPPACDSHSGQLEPVVGASARRRQHGVSAASSRLSSPADSEADQGWSCSSSSHSERQTRRRPTSTTGCLASRAVSRQSCARPPVSYTADAKPCGQPPALPTRSLPSDLRRRHGDRCLPGDAASRSGAWPGVAGAHVRAARVHDAGLHPDGQRRVGRWRRRVSNGADRGRGWNARHCRAQRPWSVLAFSTWAPVRGPRRRLTFAIGLPPR